MPLQKTNLDSPTMRALKIHSKFTEHPRQSVTPTKLHSNSIEKSHFGTETTPQTRRSLLVRRPTKDCF